MAKICKKVSKSKNNNLTNLTKTIILTTFFYLCSQENQWSVFQVAIVTPFYQSNQAVNFWERKKKITDKINQLKYKNQRKNKI